MLRVLPHSNSDLRIAYHMSDKSLSLVLVLSSALASAALAQGTPQDSSRSELARRSSGTLSFIQSRPQGTLGKNIGLGYGVDGAYLLRLDDTGIWSLRASVGGVSYGGESRRADLGRSVGGRVELDVTTSNYIVPMSIGPQLSWPTGIVRPYVNAGVGGQLFFTESRLQGTGDNTAFASTTNHSAVTAAWSVGGGVYVPLYVGKSHLDLDLGVQYFGGGTARYLAEGSIVDQPGGQVTVTPLESTTHLAIIRLGARLSR
jgi:opacity protein-like surface antigen